MISRDGAFAAACLYYEVCQRRAKKKRGAEAREQQVLQWPRHAHFIIWRESYRLARAVICPSPAMRYAVAYAFFFFFRQPPGRRVRGEVWEVAVLNRHGTPCSPGQAPTIHLSRMPDRLRSLAFSCRDAHHAIFFPAIFTAHAALLRSPVRRHSDYLYCPLGLR